MAAQKLEKNGCDESSMTMNEIKAILYKVYNFTPKRAMLRKLGYVKALEKGFEINMEKYKEFESLLRKTNTNTNLLSLLHK